MSQKNSTIAILLDEARKQERERCAKLAERKAASMADGEGEVYIASAIAKAIRKLRSR